MSTGGLGNLVLTPISEVMARILVEVAETVMAAKDVLIEKESFRDMSIYLEKITPILRELQWKNVKDTQPMRVALEALETQMNEAKELIKMCNSKNKFYLLVRCRNIVKKLQDITQEIGRALNLVPMASMNISVDSRENMRKILKDMQNVQYKAAIEEENIIEKIEHGMHERHYDTNFANELLIQIAKTVGVSTDPSSLQRELSELEKEREEAELRKNQAERNQLEQIIFLLSQADVATPIKEKNKMYQKKKNAGANQELPALDSFYCPITGEVMEDPVEIASGHAFERSAIEKWFSAGTRTCPITKLDLETVEVKPNHALRKSIEEWKERNTIHKIVTTRAQLTSNNDSDIQSALDILADLSEEKSLHGYWIAEEGLIPIIVKLLRSRNRDIRKKTLATLCCLAVNNDNNKEKMATADAVPLAVRSLARDVGESTKAVSFLLELSKKSSICNQIGKVQGCILLLVTMLNSENPHAAENAKELLSRLSNNDQNVVQMAEANHFKPLVLRLTEGSDMTKILMASALSRMGLTDHSKATLANEGAIVPLVQMLSVGKLESKTVALGALRNLSTLPENREPMLRSGILPPLLQLLFSVTSGVMSLKEEAAATLANISIQIVSNDLNQQSVALQSEETIYQLLSLLNLASPPIQGHLLRALHGISSCPNAAPARTKLREGGAIQLLLPFCETHATDHDQIRINAVKVLYSLSQDDAGRELADHLDISYLKLLVDIVLNSQQDEERAAAVGIIANLPPDDHRVKKLLYETQALPAIVDLLGKALERTTIKPSHSLLLENTANALLRFKDLQDRKLAADNGVIPLLIQLLSAGPPRAKSKAATALGQFAEFSKELSTPIVTTTTWCCFSQPSEEGCKLHGGKCSVKTSFCLLEAHAIIPLVQALSDGDDIVHEAVLSTLFILLTDDKWENGVDIIADAQGIGPIVRLLTVGKPETKEKAVVMLEKIFRIEKYRNEYGSTAQMPLIDLTQRGTSTTKPLAAKILAHLNVLHNQSSYF